VTLLIDTIIKILEKAPELAAVLLMVRFFLHAQDGARKEFLANLASMHQDNMNARHDNRETIRENTVVGRETNTLLSGLTHAVKELDRRINGK